MRIIRRLSASILIPVVIECSERTWQLSHTPQYFRSRSNYFRESYYLSFDLDHLKSGCRYHRHEQTQCVPQSRPVRIRRLLNQKRLQLKIFYLASCAEGRHNAPALCKLTFDLLTLKVVSESRVGYVPLCQFLSSWASLFST